MEKTKMGELTILNAHFADPSNALSGFYVLLKGKRDTIYGEAGTQEAKRLAQEYGFDPEGRGDAGFPSGYGVDSYTRAYWFYQPLSGTLAAWRPMKPEIFQYPQECVHRLKRLGF